MNTSQPIFDTYVKIQTYMPEACRFVRFQQSQSTISRYMMVRIGEGRLVGIRVSDHKAAGKQYRHGLSAGIPMYSIVLGAPDQRCWVHGVLWLHEQAKQPVLAVCRKAIWRHYLAFSLPKKMTLGGTPEQIVKELHDVARMQKILFCYPGIEQGVRFFLIDEINRRTKRFGWMIKKRPGNVAFERIRTEKQKPAPRSAEREPESFVPMEPQKVNLLDRIKRWTIRVFLGA
jgi:hypothetical protein